MADFGYWLARKVEEQAKLNKLMEKEEFLNSALRILNGLHIGIDHMGGAAGLGEPCCVRRVYGVFRQLCGKTARRPYRGRVRRNHDAERGLGPADVFSRRLHIIIRK